MPKGNFDAALKAVDGRFEDALSSAADARLRRVLLEAQRPPTRKRTWAIAATVVAACATFLLLWSGGAPRGPLMAGGLAIENLSGDLRYAEGKDRTVTIESGTAALSHPSFAGFAEVASKASFLREGDDLRLVEGKARFVIGKRGTKGPVRILVSHGAIEIVGTQFTVYQGVDGGRVELNEGSIRFVSLDGRSFLLQPGQTLRWPQDLNPPPRTAEKVLPAAPTQTTEEPAVFRAQPSRPPVVAKAPSTIRTLEEEQIDSAALLQRVNMLRSRGQFGEAATTLEAALEAGYRPVTRERLSYELGSIYTRQLTDSAKACAHWRAHILRFPSGRYDQEVIAAQVELGCPAVP